MSTHAMAADLGGTNIRTALVDRRGTVTHRRAVRTLSPEGRDAVMGRLVAGLDRVKGAAGNGSLAGIGVSVAGPVDPEHGTLYGPPRTRRSIWQQLRMEDTPW